MGIGIEKNINQRMWPHVLYMINKSNYKKIEVVSVIINFRMFNMSTFSCYTKISMFGEISSCKPTSIKTLKIDITSLESRNTWKLLSMLYKWPHVLLMIYILVAILSKVRKRN